MLHLLLTHAYQAMIPLSLVEGPIVAVAAGAGVASGKINPAYAAAILAFGAFFQDTIYYWVGRWAESKPKVREFAKRTRLLRDTVQPLKEAWRTHMLGTLALSKFAYGLYGPILVTAGMAGAPFGRFLLLSLGISALVLGAWFGFGVALQRIYGAMGHESYASYVMTAVGILGLVALFFAGRHARERLQRPANEPQGGTMASWVVVGEYPNVSSAEVASGLLSSLGVRNEISPEPDSLTTSGECYLSVPPEVADEARRILSVPAVSESELTDLALKEPPPDDA